MGVGDTVFVCVNVFVTVLLHVKSFVLKTPRENDLVCLKWFILLTNVIEVFMKTNLTSTDFTQSDIDLYQCN